MCKYQSIYCLMKMAQIFKKVSGLNLKKKHFQDDYLFGMRQLKGLNLANIKVQYVNIHSANFDFEKVKQNKVRDVLVQRVLARSPKGKFWQI